MTVGRSTKSLILGIEMFLHKMCAKDATCDEIPSKQTAENSLKSFIVEVEIMIQ